MSANYLQFTYNFKGITVDAVGAIAKKYLISTFGENPLFLNPGLIEAVCAGTPDGVRCFYNKTHYTEFNPHNRTEMPTATRCGKCLAPFCHFTHTCTKRNLKRVDSIQGLRRILEDAK